MSGPESKCFSAYPLLINQLLLTPLAQTPDQEIVYRGVCRYTYRSLRERIGRVAAALACKREPARLACSTTARLIASRQVCGVNALRPARGPTAMR
jgi:hypothetical protein